MAKFDDIEIFEGKNLTSLLKDIYDNTKSKDKQINDLIKIIEPLVTSIDAATILMPTAKDYMDVAVKNDKQLIDLGILIQKLVANEKRAASDGDGTGLTSQEKNELQNKAKQLIKQEKEITEVVQDIVKDGIQKDK